MAPSLGEIYFTPTSRWRSSAFFIILNNLSRFQVHKASDKIKHCFTVWLQQSGAFPDTFWQYAQSQVDT